MSDLAYHDALTGLANRVALAAHLERAVPKARREGGALGFVCLDLDGFKPINDTHGHAVGDAVLRVVAARLQECVRGGDIVARLGGDEFTVVTAIAAGAGADARGVAERVLTALRRPIVLGEGAPGAAGPADGGLAGRELRIGCSIGIALWPDDGETVEEVVRAADAALYRAKENGRNRIETTFDEAVHAC